jgi:hypothetical protein
MMRAGIADVRVSPLPGNQRLVTGLTMSVGSCA